MADRKKVAGIASAAFALANVGLQISGINSWTAALTIWAVAGALCVYALALLFREWRAKRPAVESRLRKLLSDSPDASALIMGISALIVLSLISTWVSSDARQNFAATDRAGVPIERGREECDYEALRATTSIRSWIEREAQRTAIRQSCMRLRGY